MTSVLASLTPAPLFVSPGERFAGAIDFVDVHAGLRGWVIDNETTGHPVELEVVCGSAVLARSVAMMDRPDLDQVLGRLTQCGFLLGWSRFDTGVLARIAAAEPTARVEVRIARFGQRLQSVCDVPCAAALFTAIKASPVGDLVPEFRELNDYLEIERSGLFDAAYYERSLSNDRPADMPLLLHYIRQGEAAARKPSFYFDPVAYARDASLPNLAGSLLHFLRSGAVTGLAPSFHFDGAWYEATFGVPRGPRALSHFLASRPLNPPNRWFDVGYYSKASVAAQLSDPYEDFVTHGFAAGAYPSALIRDNVAQGSLQPDAARYLARLSGRGDRTGATSVSGFFPATPPDRLAAIDPVKNDTHVRDELAPIVAGWDATEERLRAIEPARFAQVVASAEADMGLEAPAGASAALLLAIARGMRGDRRGAARAAAIFLADRSLDAGTLHPDVLLRLTRASHGWFEGERTEEASEVYRLLHQRGQRDYLVIVRLLEASLRQDDAASAAPYALELESLYPERIDAWGAAALSRFYQAKGDLRRAVGLLSAVPIMPGNNAAAEALILHRLVECEDVAAAAARLTAVPLSSAPEMFAARLRIAVRRADTATLRTMFDDGGFSTTPDWLLGEAMFILSTPGYVPLAEAQPLLSRLDALIEQRVPRNPRLLHPRMHYLLQSKRWEDLGLLFDTLEGTDIVAERETLLRRLEYYCYADNSHGAEQIYREYFQNTTLNKWEGITVLRLLSELKRWDEAAKIVIAHVTNGFSFGGAQHLAMRIVRKAAVHKELIGAIKSQPPNTQKDDLYAFLDLVREDLAILESARAFTGASHRGEYRSNWILPNSSFSAGCESEFCLFLCVNQKYFLSLLTFMCSFFGQAPQTKCRVLVFLDDDVPRHWYGAVAMVAARFGRSVDIVAEPDFVPREVEHREDYGFFAGGGTLSRAAYFRLYAARFIMENFAFQRALYMDTDTICRGSISSVFEIEIGENLICAATEDFSLDVIDAASRHGLDPKEYFNSGVLLLPLDNPLLRAAIELAINIAEREQERLMLQDQCALNIAFRGKVHPLPSRYNFFLRPHRERNGFIEDGLVLHFVDKPKPWDIVFDRTYREEWRVWALFLGSVLPQSLYVDIFAAANRD